MNGESILDITPRPLRGTLNEWRVYIRCYTLEFGGSVGPEQTAKGMYDELKVNRNGLHK